MLIDLGSKHIARMQAGSSIGDTIEQESVASLACKRVLALATRTPIEQESADSGQDKHIARMQAGSSIGDTIEQEV